MYARLFVICLFSSLISGCFPVRGTIRQPFNMKVVDETSGQPVPNAIVLVETWLSPGPSCSRKTSKKDSFKSTTDAAGMISVPEAKGWALFVFGACPPRADERICIMKPGYETISIDPWKDDPDSACRRHSASKHYQLKPLKSATAAPCFSEAP
jgi:hypothetical protein